MARDIVLAACSSVTATLPSTLHTKYVDLVRSLHSHSPLSDSVPVPS
jgi:hypothetical protein